MAANCVWINKGCHTLPINIGVVEREYGAEYVADLCTKLPSGQWTDDPIAVFYVEKPQREEYSNYLGVFIRDGSAMVCNALPAVEGVFRACLAKDGEIIFSRYRHDCRVSRDKSAMADGGRDYFRGFGTPAFLKVEGPDFTIIPPEELVREPT